MQKLRDHLNQNTDIVDRLNRVCYSGTLLDRICESGRKQGAKERVKLFFESVISFGDYVKLSDKEGFQDEVEKLYMEQNKWTLAKY